MSIFREHDSVHNITYPHKLPSSSVASKLLRPLGPLHVFTFLAVTALSRFSSLSRDSFSFLLTDSSHLFTISGCQLSHILFLYLLKVTVPTLVDSTQVKRATQTFIFICSVIISILVFQCTKTEVT